MSFYIAYADSNGAKNASTETVLQPGPGRVVYPVDGPAGAIIETPGGVIVQSAAKDSRVREWVWENYPGWFAPYQALWNQIEPLQSRYRKRAGDTTPFVYLKEDETKLLRTVAISGTTVTPTYGWLRCRVLRAIRTELRDSSSLVTYARTRLLFTIDDPSYNDL